MSPSETAPAPGKAEELEPGLRRVLAPNPSAMTLWGTNTYLLGRREIAVIDPGPDLPGHLAAILAACPPGARITHILVTHAHRDHSPLARALSRETGAPVHAFGPPEAGRSAVMQALAARGFAGGGEGVDHGFRPDITLAHGDRVTGADWELEALHTPGHMGNHLCFAWGDALFSGDHVMGWASSLVSPPDGDLSDYMASCTALRRRSWRVFHSGHGTAIEAPAERLDWLIAHRRAREASILAALAEGPATATELTHRLYTDVPAGLLPAAARNVFAHLVDLTEKNQARPGGALAFDQAFVRVASG
ncbi:MAG: MBL fold metallo-hydrolase [Rhodobacteraceae bacterium]|nr:MAG: MBL fold metallo-hydrolase [Paracoccaceae bacterium]